MVSKYKSKNCENLDFAKFRYKKKIGKCFHRGLKQNSMLKDMTHLTNDSSILEFLYGNKEINMYSVNFQVPLCKNAIFSNIIHHFNANI